MLTKFRNSLSNTYSYKVFEYFRSPTNILERKHNISISSNDESYIMSNVVNASFDPARFEITVGRISLA